MAKIVLIGIEHNDPLGRKKVVDCLKSISRDFVPDCIAVEWKKEVYEVVKNQRGLMKELIKTKYPAFNNSEIEILANTMAYEADSHTIVYPNLPVIWLDANRTVNISDSQITNYYMDRLSIYEANHYIRPDENDLTLISERVCATRRSHNPGKRDECFYHSVTEAIKEHGYDQIACVVGASHADKYLKGSFAYLLSNDEHDIHTYDTTMINV